MKRQVAIIGYSFRLPGTTRERYWEDLLSGRDLVSEVDPQRWDQRAFLHPNKQHPGTSYTFASGSVGDTLGFDAGFFGISPREAALMDPQQRLLLEMSWEAIENAGVRAEALRGSACGVYIGIASSDYSQRLVEDLGAVDATVATGNTASIAANRLSYFLDLTGPSMAIDTACSSSLVAFHQACRSIASGECTHALAGGVSLHFHPYGFIAFSKATMLSTQGRCRVFDADGDGYVRSEGGGLFLLKELEQALADGDPIVAVVANTAVNTDGRKNGLTVPNHRAQATLLAQAYRDAGIDPSEIDYLEAHGTGTAVGDPIETRAIGEALGRHRPKKAPLPIGSTKSNLGHLEAASGVAGLVKALHCLRHRTVPANIHFDTPNPHIRFDEWNLRVVGETYPLKAKGRLVVGVNSFGFGGANAHVILTSPEAARSIKPAKPVKTQAGRPLPVVVSARDPAALRAAALAMSATLSTLPSGQPATAFYDLAYGAAFRRDRHAWRAVAIGATPAEVAADLAAFAAAAANETPDPKQPPIESATGLEGAAGPAFVYSGNGSQWEGMGRQLLADPAFRAAVREVDVHFRPLAGFALEDELAGLNGSTRYTHTEIAQPALFALQVGLTQMLRDRGITPTAVCGHSVGEVAAAWAAGCLTLKAAVEVIFHRSRLQGTTKGQGQMTAVGLGPVEMGALLDELGLAEVLAIAGINGPRGITLAGDPAHLAVVEARLAARETFFRRLDIDYAFHSAAMDPIKAGVHQALAGLAPAAGEVAFFSTVTGGRLAGTHLDEAYWWHNIRHPVLFEGAIHGILAEGINCFIEVGPHAVLRSYINDCLKDQDIEGRLIPTLARNDDAPQRVWRAVAQAIIAGVPFDWSLYFPYPGRFVELPNYPWQREHLAHPVTPEALGVLQRTWVHPLLGFALPQHEVTWENPLDTRLQPVYGDHIIGEAAVFPGTGFVEVAIAAALAWQPGEFAEIEELEIRAPLILNEHPSKLLRVAVDPRDGSLSVKGREQGSGEPWVLHAVGRVLREPRGQALRLVVPEVPDRAPDFTAADHERLTRTVGLGYGPAFKAIAHGWVEGNDIIALFAIPEAVEAELADIHLHPSLLDNTFQLIIQSVADEIEHYEGIAYVPSRIGRVLFRTTKVRPHLARARVLRRSPHSLVAEFAVFGEDGTTIAVIREGRFRSVRLHKGAADHLRFLDYHGVPQPHPLAPEPSIVISPERVQESLCEMARRGVLKGTHRRYAEEVDPLLDSLCGRFTAEAMHRIAGADGMLPADWGRQGATAAFAEFLLGMALEDQSLASTPEGWRVLNGFGEQASAEDIWNGLVADYPEFFPIFHAVGRVGMHLPALVTGEVDLDSCLPREASVPTLVRQVLGGAGRKKAGLALRDLIEQGLGRLPAGQRLGVLEVSHGLPLFTHDIGVSVEFRRCDYCFASDSAETLEEAERLRERYPALDIQPIVPGVAGTAASGEVPGYQLAVCTLDFDRLDQAVAALEYARNRLAVGGSLVLIGHHGSRWIDFCFGAGAGWWDGDRTGGWASQQRTAQFWLGQLEELGFSTSDVFEFAPDTRSGPYMLAGCLERAPIDLMPEPERHPRNWLFLADEGGDSHALASALGRKLSARGDRISIGYHHDREGIAALLTRIQAGTGPVHGVVHLAGLALNRPEGLVLNRPEGLVLNRPEGLAETVLAKEAARGAIAAALIQACEQTHTDATCWLVTSGAATHLVPAAPAVDRLTETGFGASTGPVVRSSAGLQADAALWGLGRTLVNEATNYRVRLVDLEWGAAHTALLVPLFRELERPDAEEEVVLTAAGERFAPRLGLEGRPLDPAANAPRIEDPTLRLGFQFPGQLRNLRWEAVPRVAPGQGQVEVAIRATGLNFRDVMYALGMLSDEAIENGFAGPTLGLEFAGEVLRVGPGVEGIGVGDRVVGFGPSSFANRTVTSATALSLMPPGMAFEAAATIPSTFFTAYYAMHHLARLQSGERILIHGAAGGVGIAAIQVAKWIGAEVYATAGSDEKRDFLRLLGVQHIFDSRSLAFADDVLERTEGEGVDVVLNSLAGEAMHRNFRVLRPFGRFLELGKRDFYENTRVGLRPFRNNISYFGIDADQLMQERPALTCALFKEMMGLFEKGDLHPLPYHCFEAEAIVDAFRYMQQARQIGKIVITYGNGIAEVHSEQRATAGGLRLPADGTYLVTGGLRGFGLRTAEWLAERGARHLVLISRSGPKEAEAREAIARLAGQGVRVLAQSCDVTDGAAMEALLAEVRATLPPLRGVVHAAVVIEDGLVRNWSEGQIERVLAAKILGAHHLDRLTRQDPIDLFVLFSSATTLFGNPGQGNYVAANGWLETLARHRRAQGLPATAALWGAIDDAGFLARNQGIKEALQGRMGGAAIPAAVALDVLEAMILSGRSGLGVMEIDWRALSRFLPSAASPKFSELSRQAGERDGEEEDSHDIQRLLAELSDEELKASFADMVRTEVGDILRISPERIDPARSIYEMGLDSLMGVELVVAIESRFGIKLSVMALSESPTIERLAERILAQLRGAEETTAPAGGDIEAQIRAASRQHGVEVSGDQTDRLAADLRSPPNPTPSPTHNPAR